MKKKIKITKHFTFFEKQKIFFVKGPQGSCFLVKNGFFSNYNLKEIILRVSLIFTKILVLVGIGFRVESLNLKFIKLKLNYSHFILILIPNSILVISPQKTILVLKCFDNQKLTSFCSKIKSIRPINFYVGSGILYKNQKISLKKKK